MKIEPIKLSRVRKSVVWWRQRANEGMNEEEQRRRRRHKKNETKRKLSYIQPIKWTREYFPVPSTCLGLRVETTFYHFLLAFRFFGCRMSLENTAVVSVFFCFYHTDWLTDFCSCSTILIHSFLVGVALTFLLSISSTQCFYSSCSCFKRIT